MDIIKIEFHAVLVYGKAEMGLSLFDIDPSVLV